VKRGPGSRLLCPETASWRQLYQQTSARLASGYAAQEVRWLVEEASGEPWAVLYDQPEAVASRRARLRLESMVERRLAGEPLQYVLGRWNFRTLDLMVDRRVLIPRPETEQVAERALAELDRLGRPGARVVDLGTGSGAIALSIAAERTKVQVWATDASSNALDVARANLAGLGGFAATRVNLVLGHWWAALPESLIGSVHLAVSNPPYVSSVEIGSLDAGIVDWEPRTALEAGPTGLEALGEIVSGALEWLAPDGSLVLELAPHQGEAMTAQARAAGFAEVEVLPDVAGFDRVLIARRMPKRRPAR
jgi:release factor glutamine methyltransferase